MLVTMVSGFGNTNAHSVPLIVWSQVNRFAIAHRYTNIKLLFFFLSFFLFFLIVVRCERLLRVEWHELGTKWSTITKSKKTKSKKQQKQIVWIDTNLCVWLWCHPCLNMWKQLILLSVEGDSFRVLYFSSFLIIVGLFSIHGQNECSHQQAQMA